MICVVTFSFIAYNVDLNKIEKSRLFTVKLKEKSGLILNLKTECVVLTL